MHYELTGYGLNIGDKHSDVGFGIVSNSLKYKPLDDPVPFSVDSVKRFCDNFLAGKVEAQEAEEASDYEEPPEDVDDSDVTVLTTDNFKQVVEDSGKDAMLEFYAPWCGHCKSLAPEYSKLATSFKSADTVLVAKMDVTEHTPPPTYEVQGYPTLYFRAAGNTPISYDGDREAAAMESFIREHATHKL